jgi:hypothetical protein
MNGLCHVPVRPVKRPSRITDIDLAVDFAGQPDGFCAAFKKLKLDFIFEVPDLAADAWLRDMEFQRGPRNIFFLGDGDEVAEMAQFHFREHSQKLLSGKKHGISPVRFCRGIVKP